MEENNQAYTWKGGSKTQLGQMNFNYAKTDVF
jgi:hypothetical protein